MPNQPRYHRRSSSVLQTRLSQSLPPVPLPEINIPPPTIYRDEPDSAVEDDESTGDGIRLEVTSSSRPSDPPQYQPMYDYLRSKQVTSANPPAYGASPNSSALQIITDPTPTLHEPYRDEPFIVSIDSSPPPPSYQEIFRQHEIEMDSMSRVVAMESDVDPAEQTEDIYKWIVAMLLIILTIACVGTAFNWGRPL
jgi:hypothetical protein